MGYDPRSASPSTSADHLALLGPPPLIPLVHLASSDEGVHPAVSVVSSSPSDIGEDLPGTERTVNTRQLHVNLSGHAYGLLLDAKHEQPDRTFGDLITDALRAARADLIAEHEASGAEPEDDPLAAPPRVRRLRVLDSRHRAFSVTHRQAAAMAGLAAEVGIPNLSELVERAILLAYRSAGGT